MDAVTMVKSRDLEKAYVLNQKRTGKIRARGCADGRPQQQYIGKEEAISPTVSIYALIDSFKINEIGKIQVVTCDIPGSFLQSDQPSNKPTYLKYDGIMVEMLLEIDPTLKERIITKGKYRLMYIRLDKAVYGTLLGAISVYEKLARQLYEWDFIMNPYDACTQNQMVNGRKFTIKFFIDDLHIRSVDGKAIDNLVHDFNQKFKTKFNELNVCKGKFHDYLGINIDYSNDEYVKFTMYDFIEDVLKEARDDMNRLSPWTLDNKLFNVDCKLPRLSEQDADYFHRMTTRLKILMSTINIIKEQTSLAQYLLNKDNQLVNFTSPERQGKRKRCVEIILVSRYN